MWLLRHTACHKIQGASLAFALLSLPHWAVNLANASIIYVDDDGSVRGDGLSWKSAFADLQKALEFASEPKSDVTEIRIGQGVYKPSELADESDPRSATFHMLNGVAVRGGFAGIGAKDPDARDLATFQTILTGDLLNNDGAPGSFENYQENAYHVVTALLVDATATLDGVIVQAGKFA